MLLQVGTRDGVAESGAAEGLAAQIRCLFTKHKRRYGTPWITAELQTLGWHVSKTQSRC